MSTALEKIEEEIEKAGTEMQLAEARLNALQLAKKAIDIELGEDEEEDTDDEEEEEPTPVHVDSGLVKAKRREDKQCEDCGTNMPKGTSRKKKRCPDCDKEHKREYARKYMQKYKKTKKGNPVGK